MKESPASASAREPSGWDAFRELADNLPVMVWQQDASGALVFLNARWFEIMALPRESASYEPEAWRRVLHPDDVDRVRASVHAAVPERAPYVLEFRARPANANGSDTPYRWYLASAVPQHVDGAFAGWHGSIIDVQESRDREEDERQMREAAVRRENDVKAFAEALPQIAWTSDENGTIDWYNHRWYDYTGQTPEEAFGWGWQAVQHPDDFPQILQRWPQSLATGDPFEMEFRLRGRDGTFRWFLTLASPSRDEAGRILRWFGTNTDIHDRKIASERSRRVAQTLQEVFLPERLPAHPSLDFDAVYVPAESDALVGGDWYDAFVLDDGRIVVSIGDVAGHGLDAAVIAGRMRQTIFSEALTEADPAAVLFKADRVLRAQTETIATALVAVVDADTGAIAYASAGHPTPIIAEPGRPARMLEDGSSPLGTGFIPGGLITKTHTVRMEPGALVLLYTDGVTEFARDIIAGQEALLEAVERLVIADTPLSARRLYTDVLSDKPALDDIAMLALRWNSLAGKERASDPVLEKQWRFHSSHAQSAQASRHVLMAFLREHAAVDEDLMSSEIIIGELLANTVEHAPGLVEISIDWTDASPALTMRDAGRGFTVKPETLPGELSEDGRGLFLIRSLSLAFEVRPALGYGTEMRVTLPVVRLAAR